MVQKDKKLVHPDLHKIHLDFPDPKDWYPRGGVVEHPLSPGLTEITHSGGVKRPYDRIGLTERDFKVPIHCRFCGSVLYIVEETNNGVVMGCPYELCKNNPDNPYSDYIIQKARRRLGTLREDLFGRM